MALLYYMFIGDLWSVLNTVGDLCTLAHQENEATWVNALKPDIRHVLSSVLKGMAYLHSKRLQHCDLKGTMCIAASLSPDRWVHSTGSGATPCIEMYKDNQICWHCNLLIDLGSKQMHSTTTNYSPVTYEDLTAIFNMYSGSCLMSYFLYNQDLWYYLGYFIIQETSFNSIELSSCAWQKINILHDFAS